MFLCRSSMGIKIMKKKVRSKVGASGTFSRMAISSDVRSYVVDDSGKLWRWVVDNRMRDYGDIDFERRVIRINHAMHKARARSAARHDFPRRAASPVSQSRRARHLRLDAGFCCPH